MLSLRDVPGNIYCETRGQVRKDELRKRLSIPIRAHASTTGYIPCIEEHIVLNVEIMRKITKDISFLCIEFCNSPTPEFVAVYYTAFYAHIACVGLWRYY